MPELHTPESNFQRINGFVGAIHELKESTERSNRANRWLLGVALSVITTAAGFWGNEVLSRVRSIEAIQSAQATSIGKIEVKVDYAEKLSNQIDKLNERILQIERGKSK